ncbi:hypothetical protein LshimejAT787_0109390 [Lyophyllum shimeji]|uniref:Uncharacterized protein n=1 Tax=Lyophyllum shimeji TaxID=47721 RepID=A0A9P3PDI1_LYOSH|nr:hypothetical protein LshimejAT787_0109390 [Lyophyllum shimeji]
MVIGTSSVAPRISQIFHSSIRNPHDPSRSQNPCNDGNSQVSRRTSSCLSPHSRVAISVIDAQLSAYIILKQLAETQRHDPAPQPKSFTWPRLVTAKNRSPQRKILFCPHSL